jgi:DinB superfamily
MFTDKNGVLAGLANTPKILAAFVADIPEELRQRRRGQGFWTIAEHLDHLAQVQPMLLERLQRFVAEERPSFIPFIPESGEEQREKSCLPSEQALQQFTAIRRNQLELLFSVDETIWQRQGSHPEYDRYSLVILTRHMLMHDYWHMYRMEELWLAKDAFLTRLD